MRVQANLDAVERLEALAGRCENGDNLSAAEARHLRDAAREIVRLRDELKKEIPKVTYRTQRRMGGTNG